MWCCRWWQQPSQRHAACNGTPAAGDNAGWTLKAVLFTQLQCMGCAADIPAPHLQRQHHHENLLGVVIQEGAHVGPPRANQDDHHKEQQAASGC
jgi:hypothetical protein